VPTAVGARSNEPLTNMRLWPAMNPEPLSIHPVTEPVARSTVKAPSPVGESSTALPASPVKVNCMTMPRFVGVISASTPLSSVTP
jgi:hypothetical protein